MKKIFKIVVSLTLLFIISCEKEEINNQNQKSFDLEKSKLTLQQVLKEINNEKKNDLILNSLNKDKNHLSNNFIARTSADSSNYIFNKYEKNNYVTYSLNLVTYTAETPYFLNLIITNNNLEALKIGYIKYIPENPISNIDLKTFSGEIQILNTDFELKASSIFNNGIRQQNNQTNSQQRLICINNIIIIEIKCSHSGEHGVGEPCNYGFVNDAHYEIFQQVNCHEINEGPEPEFIIDINPIGNNGAGGGGSAVDASINLAINIFKSTLNPAQLAVYNSNKIDFDKYLKNNSISLPDALGAYTTNINTEAEQFVLKFIISSIESGLNLDFEKSLKSPANIDFSAIDTNTDAGKQFEWIYNKLKETTDFKELFTNTFGGNQERINVKFEFADDLPDGVYGTCRLRTHNGNYSNLIRINKSKIGTTSNLSVAKTIFHEAIHAYLNIKNIDQNLGSTIPALNGMDLKEVIGTFYQGFGGILVNGHNQTQHAFIFDHLAPVMQNALSDLKNELISPYHINQMETSGVFYNSETGINEPFNWNDLFYFLSLNGLQDSAPFIALYPNGSVGHSKWGHYGEYLGIYNLTKIRF